MTSSVPPVYLLADSQSLFWRGDGGPSFPASLRDAANKEPLKAAYVGAANGDEPAFYSIFEGAMDSIGVDDRRMIRSAYDEADRAYLRDADIILLAGGEPVRGWRVLSETGMCDDILERYGAGAILVGVSAGAALLGPVCSTNDYPDADALFESLGLVPYIIDAHDESNDWRRLKNILLLTPPVHRGIALPLGSGVIVHPDLTLEPLRRAITEFARRNDEFTAALLFPNAAGEVTSAAPGP